MDGWMDGAWRGGLLLRLATIEWIAVHIVLEAQSGNGFEDGCMKV
jgi:hypothetical protein